MDKHEDLTPAEQRYLERAGEAAQRGLTLEEYYQASGLSLDWLQKIRRQLLRKGVAPPQRAVRSAAAAPSAKFVAVQVAGEVRESGMVCRLRHPSGWVIECASWPPGRWLAECFSGASHAGA